MIGYKGAINVVKWTVRRYLLIFAGLGGYIYAHQNWGGELPLWIAHYMNDFLCMPIVLFVCRSAVRILRSDPSLQLPFPLILSVTLYFAVYFEYYLPQVNARYTADIWDVVLYFLGSIFFYRMEGGRFRLGIDIPFRSAGRLPPTAYRLPLAANCDCPASASVPLVPFRVSG